MKRPWAVLFVVVLCAGLVAGCATATALENARASFAKAKAAGAEKKAPFEYYAAEAYLGKAIHEAEEGSPKEDTDRFMKKSMEYSAKALEMSKGGAK
jgi:hypothetical protein